MAGIAALGIRESKDAAGQGRHGQQSLVAIFVCPGRNRILVANWVSMPLFTVLDDYVW